MLNQAIFLKSHKEAAIRQQLKRWLQQGYGCTDWPLPNSDTLLYFTTDSGWAGMIDLSEWFSLVMPQRAALSQQAYSLQQQADLFVKSKQPIAIKDLPAELAYQTVFSHGLLSRQQLPALQMRFTTTRGSLWLCGLGQLPAAEVKGPCLRADTIPIVLQLSLGNSQLKWRLLKKVRPGDVLLINQQACELLVGNKKIGQFSKQQGGYMLQDTVQETTEEVVLNSDDAVQEIETKVQPKNLIPVNLRFILQQQVMTVAELEAIYQGMIIPCQPDAEKKMLIVANGVTIAQGELVSIEDRIGVEVTHLYQEVGNEQR